MLLRVRGLPHVAPRLHEFFYVVGPESRTRHLVLVMEAFDTDLRALVIAWATARAAGSRR